MDTDSSFAKINRYIKDGRIGLVRPETDSIARQNSNDPFILIKCASLLKVVDDEDGCQTMLDMAIGTLPEDTEGRFSVAVALRGLGRTDDALDILEEMDDDHEVLREKARSYLASGDAHSALSCIRKMDASDRDDRILLTDILCASGGTEEAYGIAKELADDGSYESLVNLCTVLIRMDRSKEAVKIARSNIKKDKKSADSFALGAYVMWINGKIAAAANLAHSALKMDHTHIGALETMAMCLIQKKRYIEAKVMAGAVNDKEPGHPAAIRILDACRVASE